MSIQLDKPPAKLGRVISSYQQWVKFGSLIQTLPKYATEEIKVAEAVARSI